MRRWSSVMVIKTEMPPRNVVLQNQNPRPTIYPNPKEANPRFWQSQYFRWPAKMDPLLTGGMRHLRLKRHPTRYHTTFKSQFVVISEFEVLRQQFRWGERTLKAGRNIRGLGIRHSVQRYGGTSLPGTPSGYMSTVLMVTIAHHNCDCAHLKGIYSGRYPFLAVVVGCP